MPEYFKTAAVLDEGLFKQLEALTKTGLALVVLFEKDGTATGYGFPEGKCSPFGGILKDVKLVDFQATIVRTQASPDTCKFCWWENGVQKCREYPC